MKFPLSRGWNARWCRVLGLSLGWTAVAAQTPLPLTDLSSFRNPSKSWSIVGAASGTPQDAALKGASGTGVLLATPGKLYNQADYLVTNFEHGDMNISLDFMLPKGSNSGVYLMGRYEVQLYDSWGVQNPKSIDCGALYERWDDKRTPSGYEGHAPRLNASRAPGLWQHLEIAFKAPKFDASGKKISNARFVKVVLNGTIIHENIEVFGPTRASLYNDEKARGPLVLQGDHGPVAFRSVSYELLDKAPLVAGPVEYAFYSGKYSVIPNLDTLKAKPVRTGTVEKVNSTLAEGKSDYRLVFNGKLTAPDADQYQLIVQWTGKGRLVVDGKNVFEGDLWYDKPKTVDVTLSKGEHTYSLLQAKDFSWAPKVIGFYAERKGGNLQELHGFGSVPDVDPVPVIAVEPKNEAEQVRSFVWKPGFTAGDANKKLRVLHVGDPTGVHYSYDLDQASLLVSWRGGFINMADAWHERGEAQTSEPLGAVLPLWATAPVGAEGSATPDSTAGLIYKGYRLDGQGHPTFAYQLAGAEFTDFIQPYESGKGLSRTVSLKGGSGLEYRLAKGRTIASVGKGLYLVDGIFYVQTTARVRIVPNNGQQELRAAGGAPVQYELIW